MFKSKIKKIIFLTVLLICYTTFIFARDPEILEKDFETFTTYDDYISKNVAIIKGLNKITGRVTKINAIVSTTVNYGTLQITVNRCLKKIPTKKQNTIALLKIVDKQNKTKKITNNVVFSGWMFAASPGFNSLEHPIYDVWLIDCTTNYNK